MNMPMRSLVAVASLALAGWAAPASASDLTTMRVETTVGAPIDRTWRTVGPFCAIAVWSPDHAPCRLAGGEEVGATRTIPPGDLVELMAARTRYSYTYVQPKRDLLYHGTLAAEPADATHTRLIYTALYDQAAFGSAAAKAQEKKRRADRWTMHLQDMKKLVEAAN